MSREYSISKSVFIIQINWLNEHWFWHYGRANLMNLDIIHEVCWWTWLMVVASVTITIVMSTEHYPSAINPVNYGHYIGHEAGYLALQQDRVPQDHVLRLYPRPVVLLDNWKPLVLSAKQTLTHVITKIYLRQLTPLTALPAYDVWLGVTFCINFCNLSLKNILFYILLIYVQ